MLLSVGDSELIGNCTPINIHMLWWVGTVLTVQQIMQIPALTLLPPSDDYRPISHGCDNHPCLDGKAITNMCYSHMLRNKVFFASDWIKNDNNVYSNSLHLLLHCVNNYS